MKGKSKAARFRSERKRKGQAYWKKALKNYKRKR